MKTLLENLQILEDPRDIRGKKYKFTDILIMTIYGILCGMKDFSNIAYFLKIKEEYFTNLLNLKYGTPSHDCLSDVFAKIDCKKFMQVFVDWIFEFVKSKKNKIISIDGKAIKSATDKINGKNTPYIVSAFLGESGLSLGEVKVDEKSNEVTAIPKLLDLINIKNSYITIDAIGTQEKITKKIVENKGHYVLPVKENQNELLKNIKSYFNSINNLKANKEIIFAEISLPKNHGRQDTRQYYLSYNTSFIQDKEKWCTVKAIAYTRLYRTIEDETTITDNYYIIDTKIPIEKFIEVTRDHWNIECGLHWKLDVIMDEDHSRNRVENSIANLSIMRKIAFNLANLDDSFNIGNKKVPLQRKITNYMLDFSKVEHLLFDILPSIKE